MARLRDVTPRRPGQGRSNRARLGLCAAAAVCVCCGALTRAAEGPTAEQLLPDSTLAALVIPDLAAARAAAGKTKLGEMFAQPEMQVFLKPPLDKMRETYAGLRAQNPALPAWEDLDQALLSGEIALGVYPRGGEQKPPVGFIVTLKPKSAEAFARVLALILRGQVPPEGQPIPLGNTPDAPGFVWAQGRFIFAYPAAELDPLVQRMKAPPPGGQGTLAQKSGYVTMKGLFRDSVGWFFADPKGLSQAAPKWVEGLDPMVAEQVRRTLAAQSLDQIDLYAVGLGFSGGQTIVEFCETIPKTGPIAQLMNLSALTAPLDAAALKVAPPDALYVQAGNAANVDKIIPVLREMYGKMDPNIAQGMDQALAWFRGAAQVDLQKDILENLGAGTLVVVQTKLDTGVPLLPIPNLLCSMPVKNAAPLEAAFKRLGQSIAALQPPDMTFVRLKAYPQGAVTIYYPSVPIVGLPLALAVVGDRLLIGTSLSTVRRGIEQLGKAEDITSNKAFQETLARLTGAPFDRAKLPMGFAYATDEGGGGGSLLLSALYLAGGTASLAGFAEAGAKPGAPAAEAPGPWGEFSTFIARPSGKAVMGVAETVDLALWPDEAFFAKYRQPTGLVTSLKGQTIYARSELPPPFPTLFRGFGGGGMMTAVAVVGIGAAVAMPAMVHARTAAQGAAGMNTLRQVGMACQMYAAEKNKLPDDPLELIPNFFDTPGLRDPNQPGNDAPYTYLAGSAVGQGENILVYQSAAGPRGRQVLRVDGTVEVMDEAKFQAMLQDTEKKITVAGRQPKSIPISNAAIQKKRQGGAPNAVPVPFEVVPPPKPPPGEF